MDSAHCWSNGATLDLQTMNAIADPVPRGRCYRTRDEYTASLRLQQEWADFVMDVRSTALPKALTVVDIGAIRQLLGSAPISERDDGNSQGTGGMEQVDIGDLVQVSDDRKASEGAFWLRHAATQGVDQMAISKTNLAAVVGSSVGVFAALMLTANASPPNTTMMSLGTVLEVKDCQGGKHAPLQGDHYLSPVGLPT